MGGYEARHGEVGDDERHEMVLMARLHGHDPLAEAGQPELQAPGVPSELGIADSLPEYAAGEQVSLDQRAENFYA